jgi:protein-tyrosine phosphatase
MQSTRVLFVCLGNICRSPTAEGVCRHLAAQRGLDGRVELDSAGTGAWHAGEPPDRRAQAEARRRGIDLSGQRARAVRPEDFARFDHILAMDADNLAQLRAACPAEHRHKIRRLLDLAPELGVADVPDPYYGGSDGFRRVFDLVERACGALLDELARD